jgi:hypothetical protein
MMLPLNLGQNIGIILIQNGNPFGLEAWVGFSSGQNEDGDWRGEIRLHRSTSNLEKAVDLDPVFLILATVTDPDGQKTQFFYHEATLRFDAAGEWNLDSFVSQIIKFTATRRTING